jgi:hypothetical protein
MQEKLVNNSVMLHLPETLDMDSCLVQDFQDYLAVVRKMNMLGKVLMHLKLQMVRNMHLQESFLILKMATYLHHIQVLLQYNSMESFVDSYLVLLHFQRTFQHLP